MQDGKTEDGARPPRRYWATLTSPEIAATVSDRTIAVLPVGAVEQHGPHLPLIVDTAINGGIIATAVARMPAELPALVLPGQAIGTSREHAGFAGTISLSPETLLRLWTEVAENAIAAGVKKLLIFNTHGGQTHLAEVVAMGLRARHGVLASWTSWTALGLPDDIVAPEERAYGIHGGALETAMMLHLHPDLVRQDKIGQWPSAAQEIDGDSRHLTAGRRVGWAWMAQDLNAAGVVGDATQATAEMGKRLVEHAADRLIELLWDLDRFDLARLRDA